jgi:hypothetical protein
LTISSCTSAALDGRFDPVAATRLWLLPSVGEPLSVLSNQPLPHIDAEEPGVLELLAIMEGAFPELQSLWSSRLQQIIERSGRTD